MSFCTNCGTQFVPQANFCTGCGQSVSSHEPIPAVDESVRLVDAQGTATQHMVNITAESVDIPADVPVAPQPTSQAQAVGTEWPITRDAVCPPAHPAPMAQAFVAPVPPLTHRVEPLTPAPELAPGVEIGPAPQESGLELKNIVNSLNDALDSMGIENDSTKKAVMVAGGVIGGVLTLLIVVKALQAFFESLGFFGFVVVIFMVFAVIGIVLAARAHAQESREVRTLASLPPSVQHVVAQMDGGAQAAFFNEYERVKKRAFIAYLLWWLCGAHYFYLRQTGLNVLYWFTLAGMGWWALIDIFRMRSLVRVANEQSARQAMQTLHIGAAFAQMPAAPLLMRQPVPPTPSVMPGPYPSVQDR